MSRYLLLLALLALAFGAGCGTSVYQPARTAGFRLDDPREIDDETIAKAFAAKPQMPDQVRVAYYVFDDEQAEPIEQVLTAVPGVVSTYRLPTFLVDGSRKLEQVSPYRQPERAPIRIKQLRLLAARAGADVLVIVDQGHRVSTMPNGLVALGVAIVPLFFVPWHDVEVESYADSYVIDVRNGYLYGQASTDRSDSKEFLTIYNAEGEAMVEQQLDELMNDTRSLLTKVVEDARRDAAGAKGSAAQAQVAEAP